MSVLQISKIQIRRGRANTTGIPQLASGELGWAVDTQQLFIGNGSISEGAPFVGNTKILTENDNIFDIAISESSYQYRKDSAIETGNPDPISRSIQARLDDQVSVKSFIAPDSAGHVILDGTVDYTADLQRAIDQLFLNSSDNSASSRVVLEFPPGIYKISEPLRIPPYATLRGAGKDKTIIQQTGAFPVFYTIGGNSSPGSYSAISTFTNLNQPQYINISGFTFENTTHQYPIAVLNATRDSTFSDIKFKGPWESGPLLYNNQFGIQFISKTGTINCTNNIFDSCEITGVSYGVYSDHDIDLNTFTNSKFSKCGYGIMFGKSTSGSAIGELIGPTNNRIVNSTFKNIDKQGICILKGKGNVSSNNKFILVGNDGGSNELTATYPIIEYAETGNISDNDYFDRVTSLATTTSAMVSEYAGHVSSIQKFTNQIAIIKTNVPTHLLSVGSLKFDSSISSTSSVTYKIHYAYTSTALNYIRSGILSVVINHTFTSGISSIAVSDEFDINGDSQNSDYIHFTASLEDRNSDSIIETVYIKYTNTGIDDVGYLNYWYQLIA